MTDERRFRSGEPVEPSGSRWEPAYVAAVPEAAAAPPSAAALGTASPARDSWLRRLPSRVAAATAAALLLAGGAGGFAVGQALAGDQEPTHFSQHLAQGPDTLQGQPPGPGTLPAAPRADDDGPDSESS